jgi:hypothetical protein
VSSKKELVVIGDSFCIDYINMRNLKGKEYDGGKYLLYDPDQNKIREFKWTKQKSFPIWTEIVAKKLNLKLVSLGQSGTGTDFHFAGVLDYIINNKKKIRKVIISWSSFGRFDFEFPSEFNPPPSHPWPWMSVNGALLKYNKLMNGNSADTLLNAAREVNALTFEVGINNFFRHSYVLQNLLESYGIEYRMIQSLSDGHAFPNKYHTHEGALAEYAKYILKSPYFDLINDEKFIGWPGIPLLGGFTMVDLIFTEDNKNFISSMDHHPNENGMKIIAKAILDDL